MAVKKKEKKEEGAPAWMVTYGDMMSLLLTFFIMLVAMSKIKEDEFQKVMESLREAFGYVGGMGTVPTHSPPDVSLLKRLESIVIPKEPKKIGDTDDLGIEGKMFRVTQVREGLKIIVGGRITFDKYSAKLKPRAVSVIKQVAERIRGHTTKIEIRGHTTREPLPPDSVYADLMDLAYARAKAVAKVLIDSGVKPQRIRIVACGPYEPLVAPAYTEEQRAVNRRVEIVVSEVLVSELVGQNAK